MSNIDIPFWVYSSLNSNKHYVKNCLTLFKIEIVFENNKQLEKCFYGNKNNEVEVIIFKFNNKIHRDNDKPAIIWLDNHNEWLQYGRRNRENDKPAVISDRLGEIWFIDNIIRRKNGKPSFINYKKKEYYIEDSKEIPFSEIQKIRLENNTKFF